MRKQNWGRTRVGQVFPKTLEEENFLQKTEKSPILRQIYSLILEHYKKKEWKLEDFKNFRHVFMSCDLQDTEEEYQELISYFLSLSPEEAENRVMQLDQELHLELFKKKELVIQIDPNTKEKIQEYYKVIKRKYVTTQP